MQLTVIILAVVAGFAAGLIAGFIRQSKSTKKATEEKDALQMQLYQAEKQKEVAVSTLTMRNEEIQQLRTEMARNLESVHLLTAKNASQESELRNAQEKLDFQKKETEEIQKRLTSEFENIAGRILKNRTDEFNATNARALGDILLPLKEKIVSFEKKSRRNLRQGIARQNKPA